MYQFVKTLLLVCFIAAINSNCSTEYDCGHTPIQTLFVGFSAAEIDTLEIRKFNQNDNFQHVIDSFAVINGLYGPIPFSHDTAYISIQQEYRIQAGFDWQIFIPSQNRIVSFSSIVENKKTGKCGTGIFASNKSGCICLNALLSLKQDNTSIIFSTPDAYDQYVVINH